MNYTGKVWGDTKDLMSNPFVEVHELHIDAGMECSMHKHNHKYNGFYLIEGRLEIHVKKNDYDLTDITELDRFDRWTIVPPGEYHKFVSISNCKVLEIYWPEGITDDIERMNHGGPTK